MAGLGHVSLAADGWDLNTVPEALLQTAAVAAAATTATKISPELFPRIQKRTVYPSKTPVMRKTLPSIQKTLLNDFYARNTAINAEILNDFCMEYSRLYRTHLNDFFMEYSLLCRKHQWMILHGTPPSMQKKQHSWMIFAWNTLVYTENTLEWFFLHGILPSIQKQILQSMHTKKPTPEWFLHGILSSM